MSGCVLRAKEREWAATGRITHSDMHFLAAKLLCSVRGERIRDLIARRYQSILVDELQDTGHFLGLALLAMLSDHRFKSLLVGDPDQAIYGFGGVDRTLFRQVEALADDGQRELRTSHRFGPRVAELASKVARSGLRIAAAEQAPNTRVVVVPHRASGVDMGEEVWAKLETMASDAGCVGRCVMVRKRTWVRTLTGASASRRCPLSSRLAKQFSVAVESFLVDDVRDATRLAEQELCRLVTGERMPSRRRLADDGVDPRQLREMSYRCLRAAASFPSGETWGGWSARLKTRIKAELDAASLEVDARTLGGAFRTGSQDRADTLREMSPSRGPSGRWSVVTVHEAKGREYDCAVIFCPKPGGRHRGSCPSVDWFDGDGRSEEREVGYVAITRAKKVLVLLLHEESIAALDARDPNLLADAERLP